MKKRIIAVIIAAAVLTQGLIICANDEPELIKKRATAYCLQGVTSSGETVRPGICASGDATLFGKRIIMYQRLPDGSRGKWLGVFDCLDTGCSKYVIDVWLPNYELCKEYMQILYEDGCAGKVFIEVVDNE